MGAAAAPVRKGPARKGGAGRRSSVVARAPRRQRRPQRHVAARRVRGRPGPAQLVPIALGRTAVAVRSLPDSGLVVRLTRGRAWIGVLSVMLTGIVALNVISLSLSASQGRISRQAAVLEQENSALRARLAHRLSNGRVRNAAASIGMTSPSPTEISYRDASAEAVRLAARRLAAGFTLGGWLVDSSATTTMVPATPTATSTTMGTPAPSTTSTTPASPTAAAPTATVPASGTSAPATTPSAPAAPVSTATAGGGVSPG
jgi:hypothetical protein